MRRFIIAAMLFSCSVVVAGEVVVQRTVLDSEVPAAGPGTYVGNIEVFLGNDLDFTGVDCLTTVTYREVWGLEVQYTNGWPRIVKIPTDKTSVQYRFDCPEL